MNGSYVPKYTIKYIENTLAGEKSGVKPVRMFFHKSSCAKNGFNDNSGSICSSNLKSLFRKLLNSSDNIVIAKSKLRTTIAGLLN